MLNILGGVVVLHHWWGSNKSYGNMLHKARCPAVASPIVAVLELRSVYVAVRCMCTTAYSKLVYRRSGGANATRNVQRVQKYTLVQPRALVGIHIRCHYVSFAGGKYTLLMYAPLTMLFLTLYSNCLGLLCISCAASLFSGSSGFGSCRHKAILAAYATCQTRSRHTF